MTKESGINITKAVFPAPFESGLEYNPPTRGVWNIVHTGMLIPESRQIFVCAQGCLRGVILTAAEMNAMDRMSWVTVSEQDLYDGTMEQDVIDGVRDIINRLEEKPKCVLIFLSCVHLLQAVTSNDNRRTFGIVSAGAFYRLLHDAHHEKVYLS